MKRSEADKISDELFYVYNEHAGTKIRRDEKRPFKIMYKHSPGILKGNHCILASSQTQQEAEERLKYYKEGFLRSIYNHIEP